MTPVSTVHAVGAWRVVERYTARDGHVTETDYRAHLTDTEAVTDYVRTLLARPETYEPGTRLSLHLIDPDGVDRSADGEQMLAEVLIHRLGYCPGGCLECAAPIWAGRPTTDPAPSPSTLEG